MNTLDAFMMGEANRGKEMMVFDIYSSNGRAVIDLVPGRIDDPAQI